jgi:amino acid transporter
MNFEEIKRKMDSDGMDDMSVPTNITQLKDSKIPIQAVRKSMKSEIITQSLIIVIFFAVPSFLALDELTAMSQLATAIYYILQFITSLITLLYLAKMNWFLRKTSDLGGSSKDTVMAFIYDLQITLEVYKTAIISGSLILPISMLTLGLGFGLAPAGLFEKFITLDFGLTTLLLIIGGYLLTAVGIYYITVKWADMLYGIHIKDLQTTLKEFEV